MNDEIRKTDREIYGSKAYKNVRTSIVIAMLSGVFLCLAGGFFYFEKSVLWSVILAGFSILGFITALFIGHYKLFPEEEYKDGVSKCDDRRK